MTLSGSEENVSGSSRSAGRDSQRWRAVEPAKAESGRRDSEHPPHNLPAELSSFIGREWEIEELKRLLTETRLLTLTGSGGSGKTRLALKVARSLVEEFEDGVWLVELASLSDAHLVPQTLASVLHVREQPDRSLTEVLIEHFEPKKLLLVLDNCEHLVGTCAELAETLLLASPGLHILATSREPLGVRGEISWLVHSLSFPGHPHRISIEKLSAYEAVRLFIERATAALSTFALTDQNAPKIVEVCRKLEGMPLAIELAAARVRVLSAAQISERLERCFRLLATDSHTAVPRQRTLRATIDWSYGLLPNAEQTLFRRLAVFSGGFTLKAAEEVCSGEGIEEDHVLDLLSRLVDKSLVLVAEQGGQEARYRLLETVRQYGWERLSELGEVAEIKRRHTTFFLELAEGADRAIMGPGQQAWVERLEQEHDNLRAAQRWLREEGEVEQGLRLAGALGRFWWFRGYFSEGRAQLEDALGVAGEVAWERTGARAKVLHTLGVLIYRSADYSAGDQESARSHLQESVDIYRELGDRARATAVLRELGYLSAEAGDWETGRSSLEESLRLERQSGDEHGIALTRSYLGIMAVLQDEHDTARAHLEESLEVLRRLGELPEAKVCAFYRGLLACDEGDYATARARFAEQVEDAPLQIYRYALPWVLQGYAQLATAERQPARALRLAGAAAALHRALGQSVGLAAKAYFQRRLKPAWRALGEQEGIAAFEEGQAMTFGEALAYLLEEPRQKAAEDPSGVAQAAIKVDPAGLTARELEVLKLVAEGLTDAQVAQRLYLSPRTVGHHLRRIYRKLSVSSRTAAVREAAGRGLI